MEAYVFLANTPLKQLPRTKKVVTQDRSKVLRETEENPFHDDDEETPTASPSTPSPSPAGPSHSRQSSLTTSTRDRASSILSSSKKSKKDKDKDKDKKKKHKPFNLEAEKEGMKAAIAESAVASTNLLNALRHINREKERISENKTALQHFDSCKLLRRKILRYVSLRLFVEFIHLANPIIRSNMLKPKNGSEDFFMQTMNWSMH